MIKTILICDENGYPFYSRHIDKKFAHLDPILFSGLISAIGTLGKQLFKEEIAKISYGTSSKLKNIVVVKQELFGINKAMYFVFITKGEVDYELIHQLKTAIFMATKHDLKHPGAPNNNKNILQTKIDKVIGSIRKDLLID